MPTAATPVRHPIAERLPGIYIEDDFVQRFTAALDDVLAPVIAMIDGLAAYFDPDTAPEDFLPVLTSWVALGDVDLPGERHRALLTHAVRLHQWRGTRPGLTDYVEALTGGAVEVRDTGGCVASDRSGGPLPGSDPAGVLVRVRVPHPDTVDQEALVAAITEFVPVHVSVAVEVLHGSMA